MTKPQALAAAKIDFAAARYGLPRISDVWGGTTAYMAERQGIYRISRHDSGARVASIPDRLIVPASRLSAQDAAVN